ncbi:MAG: DEAD/DEAH box helicase family protein [Candidatus Promineifilaceae bacterium]
MPRRKPQTDPAQLALLQAHTRTAPCVPAIREAVAAWAAAGYKGVTPTTRTLLNHWFHTDHRLRDGGKFAYFYFQKEALQTLIFLYEVAQIRRHKDLLQTYATATPNLRLLQYDAFPRYCLKMATGTGKTKVISLVVAWQYFNAILEDSTAYAANTLLLAPNLIVYERLRTDFEGGRIFRADPVIPPALQIFWDFDCYMRGDSERAASQGALYLTNIQQLYERQNAGDSNEPDIMTLMLGPKPPAQMDEVEPFDQRLVKRGGSVLVVNDEAHHTHDEENEWNRTIRRLHDNLAGRNRVFEKNSVSNVVQLDMTATPRYSKGALFTWTVFDYPLKQAILDNVVKRPLKGIAKGLAETPSDVASIRYQTYLTAGVQRWREYRDKLQPLKRKPVLFIMMNSTRDADDVADYLRTKYPGDFAGDKLHVIHTNRQGDVSAADLEDARKIAHEIDEPDNPINGIISVLMLREGWDVQNVTVIVGLRPYTAKANILPEQTIGRGLRLMFRGSIGANPSFQEHVDVIGNKAFIEFVTQLERDEDLALDTVDLDTQPVVIETIYPDPAKQDKDIAIPTLSPLLTRKRTLAEEIAGIDVSRIQTPKLPKKEGDAVAQAFTYEGYDIITLEKILEREYTIPEVQTSQEVISYYAKRIASDLKLPSQFAVLVPKIREFLTHYAFGETVNLDEPAMIKAISHRTAQHVTVKAFTQILRDVIVEEQIPVLESAGRPLSDCPGFPWSRPTLNAGKTVFNLVAADNEFEKTFAAFLQNAPDVVRFAKLPEKFGFAITYTDAAANLRYYEPDFVAVDEDGVHHLIETKGREDIDVKHKDRAAQLWCENAGMLTGVPWQYRKVLQKEFENLHPHEFADLIALDPITLLDWSSL